MKTPFSTEDMERITKAVNEAEQKTSGEIVPYYVQASDEYEEVIWRGGMFFGGLAMVILIGLQQFTDLWLEFGIIGSLFIVLAAGALGILVAMAIRPIRLALAGKALIDRRVAARALEAFVEQEVFDTRDRTGILIFLSLYERRVQVIGDSGINEQVPDGFWTDVVGLLKLHFAAGRHAEGLVEAVHLIGEKLSSFFPLREDDTDELSNEVSIGRR